MLETSSEIDDCRCDFNYLRKKNALKLDSQTTNKRHFQPHPIPKQQKYEMPKIAQKHYDPEVLKSSYKTQFSKPRAPDTAANMYPSSSELIQSYKVKKKNVPFYSQTEYKKSFQPSDVKVQKQPEYVYKPKNTKFQGESSYKSQFVPKKNTDILSAGQEIEKYIESYKKPKIKFEGESAYKSTFVKHENKPQKQPEYKYEKKNTKFEGQSSYSSTFTPIPKQAYQNSTEYCPIHPDRIAIKK